RRDLPRMFEVGPATEILEHILLVRADHRFLGDFIAVLIHFALSQSLDQFQLIGLIVEQLARLIRTYLAIDKGVTTSNNPPHPLFDLSQIFGREGERFPLLILAEIKIVIKPRINRWPNG